MKEYLTPVIETYELNASDVIATSPGTETDPKPDDGGIWDLDIG